jgi:salicylate hydroxylase
MAVLERLGVAAHLLGGVEPAAIEVREGQAGRLLTRIPLGNIARRRYGAPYCLVHRADLQSALLATVHREPQVKIRLGCEAAHVSAGREQVKILAGEETVSAAVLIGADGVHSRLRSAHFGHGAESLQHHALRGLLPAADVAHLVNLDVTGLWLAAGAHLVHYPVRGGALLNVAVIAAGEPAPVPPVNRFGPEIRALIEAVPAWTAWPLSVVDPGRPWVRGRAVLIGDAAHAMAPSLAQGGAQAIEDAWVLAQSLAALPHRPDAALAAYEATRRPRVQRVVREARRNLRIYELARPWARARDTALRLLPPDAQLRRLDWLFGWNPG